jgi:hypothetical protein
MTPSLLSSSVKWTAAAKLRSELSINPPVVVNFEGRMLSIHCIPATPDNPRLIGKKFKVDHCPTS